MPGLSATGGGDSVARHLDSLNDPAFGELLVQLEAAEAATGAQQGCGRSCHGKREQADVQCCVCGSHETHMSLLASSAHNSLHPPLSLPAYLPAGIRPPVISFSHFLPRQELLPEKRMLYIPNLAKAAGSDFLYSRCGGHKCGR